MPASRNVPARKSTGGFAETTEVLSAVCGIAGSLDIVENIRAELMAADIPRAVIEHDTPVLFDWVAETASYQGISDKVARDYLRKHGSIRWDDIETALAARPRCQRLGSYWSFEGCRYDKGSYSCAEPELIDGCSLPTHRLRNGRLNQTAYSLYLFMRDIANSDLVGWIDAQLGRISKDSLETYRAAAYDALVGPLRNVFGLSDKVLTMVLSNLLMVDRAGRPQWFLAGSGLTAIDTLVHNFLHRTGILVRHEAEHTYGPRCYAANGCADIIHRASAQIDAARFNPAFPADFPRFVQHAIWRFCAGDGLNICNGVMIDDAKPCQNPTCQLGRKCEKMPLRLKKTSIFSTV